MSLTMAKADGVTVFTLTSDPQSSCPPLCQILKGLCYSPACCSVSQRLKRVQGSSLSVLGALHIMVGLLNIGLGLTSMMFIGNLFGLGAMFISLGVVSILSEKFPSRCLVLLNVILNLAGVGFAIAAIVFYSIRIPNSYRWWTCDGDYYSDYHRPTPSPLEDIIQEMCMEGKTLVMMLDRSTKVVLVVLSVLELCVVISSVVLGIKALRSSEKPENQSIDDPELNKPLLEEVTSDPVA